MWPFRTHEQKCATLLCHIDKQVAYYRKLYNELLEKKRGSTAEAYRAQEAFHLWSALRAVVKAESA